MSDENALARRLSVSEIVAAFERAERDLRAGFALLAGVEKSVNDTFVLGGTGLICIKGRYTHRIVEFDDPESSLTELRRDVWGHIVERLELRRMMSIRAWKELQDQIKGAVVPEINEATVSAMLKQFHDALPSMLEEAVGEVFEWLRPPSSRLKTNSQLEIGKRVILSMVVERYYSDSWRVRYESEPRLTALENVFSALDGKGSITKGHYSEISLAIKALKGAECCGETAYFRFRGCKNRNLHVEFKRLDLLKRLNQIAGGKRLRPAGRS